MQESEFREGTDLSWVTWVCAHGLATPAWFFLEVIRLNAGWLTPFLDLVEPFLPVSELLPSLSTIQRKLEGKSE